MKLIRRSLLGFAGILPFALSVWAADAVLTSDTYTSQSSPANNYGTLTSMLVGSGNSAWIQFNLSLPPGIVGANISKATLVVFANRVSIAGTIDLAVVNGAWEEDTLTSNTQPAVTATGLTAAVTQPDQYIAFDVTTIVQSWFTAPHQPFPNNQNGFQLSADAGTPNVSVLLDTKESTTTSHPAELQITLVDIGPQGPPGPIGLTGPTGPTGPPGIPGPLLALPYSATTTSAGPAFTIGNLSGTGAATGVYGQASSPAGAGVSGNNAATSGGFGVTGTSSAPSGAAAGVYGQASSPAGAGVSGNNAAASGGSGVTGTSSASSGVATGVYGQASSPAGAGVSGNNTATSGGFGVTGTSSASSGAGVSGNNNAGGSGVLGTSSAPSGVANGVYGQASSPAGYGVQGYNGAASGYAVGVFGTSPNSPIGIGVFGASSVPTGAGVGGNNNATSGPALGVVGQSWSPAGAGVQGSNNAPSGGSGLSGISAASSGVANGVYGQASSPDGYGVQGHNGAGSGFAVGVFGASPNSPIGIGVFGSSSVPSGLGVSGNNNATSGNAIGVLGQSWSPAGSGVHGSSGATSGGVGVSGSALAPNGIGVQGFNTSTTGLTYGVAAAVASPQAVALFASNNAAGLAGQFIGSVVITGDLTVTGNISKNSGSFKIDHPLDPENKYLYHSFVESPDMMNIYNGVIVLNEAGEATVTLPDWFEALNEEFRYQLTCVGGYAPVYVFSEVAGNRFQIAGGRPGLKVSWQVTGIRHDAYANAHRIPVEVEKPENERGAATNRLAMPQTGAER